MQYNSDIILICFFFASQRPKQFHSVFCFSGGSVLTIGTFYCATPCPTYCSRWHRSISVYFQWQTFFPSPQVIPHYWHSFKLKHQLHSISQLLLYGFSGFPNYLPWPFSFQSIQYLPPLSAGDCAGYEQRQESGTLWKWFNSRVTLNERPSPNSWEAIITVKGERRLCSELEEVHCGSPLRKSIAEVHCGSPLRKSTAEVHCGSPLRKRRLISLSVTVTVTLWNYKKINTLEL